MEAGAQSAQPTDSELPRADNELAERRLGKSLRNGIIALLVLVALVVGLLVAVPNLHGVTRLLGHAGGGWIALAVGLELLSCVGYVLVFQLVFARAPLRFAARVAWSELAFGAAVPLGGAGGLALGAWVFHTRGAPAGRIAERSAVLFLLTSAINVIVLTVMGLGLAVGVFAGPHNALRTVVPAAVGAGALVFFLAIPRYAGRAARRQANHGRLARLLLGLAESIRATTRLLVAPNWRLIGAFAFLLCDIGVLWICFRALGHTPPFAAMALAYQIGYLANVVPIPGGIGFLDAGLVGMLVVYGNHATGAAAAVLAYHVIALWVPTLIGTIAFVLLQRTRNEPLRLRPAP